MTSRPWRWLKTKIFGLLTRPPVVAGAWPSRLQHTLYGPIEGPSEPEAEQG